MDETIKVGQKSGVLVVGFEVNQNWFLHLVSPIREIAFLLRAKVSENMVDANARQVIPIGIKASGITLTPQNVLIDSRSLLVGGSPRTTSSSNMTQSWPQSICGTYPTVSRYSRSGMHESSPGNVSNKTCREG
jgi:hypothetical protein